MMTHYKGDVKAWDVLNEPMKENGTLRDGNVAEPADDEFYWVKYLGEDLALKAFQLAREHGGDDQLLFMNDYNLENPAKVDGFIAYAQDQIAKGAPIDGLGTQMHVSLSTSKENIAEMFSKLAATGLLVKVSELDVQVGTTTPSLEQLLQQAEMYQYIVEKDRKSTRLNSSHVRISYAVFCLKKKKKKKKKNKIHKNRTKKRRKQRKNKRKMKTKV